ncbi:MAG: LicD family protein [Propionibacteriaceae bacterium]|nr:LicD family protein [Propionibacteriaceae bacterium]
MANKRPGVPVKVDTPLFRQLQEETLQTLIDFDAICAEHHLTYYLAGGALIGAVREGGFIPWDDDIDVHMPRADYERMLELFGDREINHCILFHYKTWPKYYLTFAKVVTTRPSGFIRYPYPMPVKYTRPFVDVFPLEDGYAKTPAKRVRWLRIWRDALFMKVRKYKNLSLKKRIIRRPISKLFTYRFLQRYTEKLYRANEGKPGTDYYVAYSSPYLPKRETNPKSAYGEPVMVTFEGRQFPAPADWDHVLRTAHKDYMKRPDPEKVKARHAVTYWDDPSGSDADGRDAPRGAAGQPG